MHQHITLTEEIPPSSPPLAGLMLAARKLRTYQINTSALII